MVPDLGRGEFIGFERVAVNAERDVRIRVAQALRNCGERDTSEVPRRACAGPNEGLRRHRRTYLPDLGVTLEKLMTSDVGDLLNGNKDDEDEEEPDDEDDDDDDNDG